MITIINMEILGINMDMVEDRKNNTQKIYFSTNKESNYNYDFL